MAEATTRLRRAGIDTPRLEARLLLEHVTGLSPIDLILGDDNNMAEEAMATLAKLVARRAAHEPLAYVLGQREFWSLPLRTAPNVLIPRPDTETVVEAVLAARPERAPAYRVVDLGTGSGALLLALLREYPNASGLGIDLNPDAVRLARQNAADLGFTARATLEHATWHAALSGTFDIIVANPPYVPRGEIATLAADVRDYEPHDALDGGADGLAAYHELAPLLAAHLTADGVAALEVGRGQAEAVGALLQRAGLRLLATRADLAGIVRAVVVGAPVPAEAG